MLVKRDGREYHIYGTGKDRQVFSLKRPTTKTATGADDVDDRHDRHRYDFRRHDRQRQDHDRHVYDDVGALNRLTSRAGGISTGRPAADPRRAAPTPARA